MPGWKSTLKAAQNSGGLCYNAATFGTVDGEGGGLA
jgi:hypothetical protein